MITRKPNRLKHFDYSNSGWYYVTICTKDHENYFGDIENGLMVLNVIGKITNDCWNKIETLHENIQLDYYVIMPNHIHGIIIIENKTGDAKFASPPVDRTKMELCKLIQQFKRAVTIEIKSMSQRNKFKWQRSFHDRIIRNEKQLFNIRKYIQQNPLKWNLEKSIMNVDFSESVLK